MLKKNSIYFVNHASILLKGESKGLLTDPWYWGDCFNKGWLLLYNNTDNEIILAQQLEISKLKKDIKRISNKMEKTDEYINDLYWALFHAKPCVIAAIIEPDL